MRIPGGSRPRIRDDFARVGGVSAGPLSVRPFGFAMGGTCGLAERIAVRQVRDVLGLKTSGVGVNAG